MPSETYRCVQCSRDVPVRHLCPDCREPIANKCTSDALPDVEAVVHEVHWKDAIDYPVSWTFWRAWYRQHGEDPGPCEPEEDSGFNVFEGRLQSLEELASTQTWKNQQWDYAQQLKAQILFLENKLNEHIDYSKKKKEQRYKWK